MAALRQDGLRVSFLQLLTLFPVPRQELDWALADVDTVLVAEENLTGQYRAVLAPYLGNRRVLGVNKIGGLITPNEIIRAVRAAEG